MPAGAFRPSPSARRPPETGQSSSPPPDPEPPPPDPELPLPDPELSSPPPLPGPEWSPPPPPGPDRSSSITLAHALDGATAPHLRDCGPGLDAEQRRRAFDRFWRADHTARAEYGGSGLGLAIVARLAAVDGGRARLDDAPGGGLDAVVTVPP